MNLRPEQLSARLEGKGPLAPLWVVHGDEALLVLEAADRIRAAAREHGFLERETLVVGQNFRWEALSLAAGNLSLFGDAKLIDLRIPGGKPGREGGIALQRHAAALPAQVLTLVSFPELDWASRKTAWFKALSDAGMVVEANAPPREQLPQWIAGRLALQAQHADADALAFIAEQVEGNLLAAHQEIRKLGMIHPSGGLSLEQVRDAVLDVTRYDIDLLRTAASAGDAARCVRLLDGLRGEGVAPPLVLWALASETRLLATMRSGRDEGQPLASLFKRERVFDAGRQRTITSAVAALPAGRLRAAIVHAARIDRMIKGVLDGNVWDELLQLTLRLARRS